MEMFISFRKIKLYYEIQLMITVKIKLNTHQYYFEYFVSKYFYTRW